MPITYSISGLDKVREILDSIDMSALCLEIASTLKGRVKHRIHVEGKASDGSKIGTYSKEYMVVRTGAYKNKKGKDSGFYTKGKGAVYDIKSRKAAKVVRNTKKYSGSSMRPKYNRGVSDDVILSLTRQMEKDMDATQPIKIEGGYGIGFSNDFNYNKAVWNDNRYGKPIYALTSDEEEIIDKIVNKYISEKMS